MSRSHGRATAQNFPDFAQNLEIFMRKLRMYAFTPQYTFFHQDSHILCDFCVILALFLAQTFQKLSFDHAKKSTFRMPAFYCQVNFQYFCSTFLLLSLYFLGKKTSFCSRKIFQSSYFFLLFPILFLFNLYIFILFSLGMSETYDKQNTTQESAICQKLEPQSLILAFMIRNQPTRLFEFDILIIDILTSHSVYHLRKGSK